MIRIHQLKLDIDASPEDLAIRAAKALRLPDDRILSVSPVRRSLDARRKPDLFYAYTVDVKIAGSEASVLRRAGNPNASICEEKPYRFPAHGSMPLRHRPVIAGFGPAGMFAARMLAEAGFRPLVLERGEKVDDRVRKVGRFWDSGRLDPESNVQFGEGGAGTFSDGKLNTLVKDPAGRGRKVMEIFADAGADPSIRYVSNPHIGTDVLAEVVRRIREDILRMGGEIRFGTKLEDIGIEDGALRSVTAGGEMIPAEVLIVAPGHSARDTFAMLRERGLPMEARPFAVGLRVQHPQAMINLAQYGREDAGTLGAASYKLTHQTKGGRGVYSFCMCPGGYVVNASSEPGRLAVNGMSYHDRAGENANSALIVTVTPADYGGDSPLAGIAWQRRLEEAAFAAGGGMIPVQLFGDFLEGKRSAAFGGVAPAFRGGYAFGDMRGILPGELSGALAEGILAFGKIIPGYDRPDMLLAGVESRTSSPLRLMRGKELESPVSGIYPCGEGAGYAGGITSAAMDGIRVAEMIASRFAPAEYA